jgi:hypothetical protein
MLKTFFAFFKRNARNHQRLDRRVDAWTQLIGHEAAQLWLEALSGRDNRPFHI